MIGNLLKEERQLNLLDFGKEKIKDYNEVNIVNRYLEEINKIPLLFLEEEIEVSKKVMKNDQEAWEKLIISNLRLVVKVAKGYQDRGVPLLDLIQEGNLGLIKAVEKFDYSKGCKFSTYAIWWIIQTITGAIVDQARLIKVPRGALKKVGEINRISNALSYTLKREATLEEITQEMNLPIEEIRDLQNMTKHILSLETPVGDKKTNVLVDIISDDESVNPEKVVLNNSLKKKLEELVNKLTPRQAEVIKLRYGLEDGIQRTLEEIGKLLGVTAESVRQTEERALRNLRSKKNKKCLEKFL